MAPLGIGPRLIAQMVMLGLAGHESRAELVHAPGGIVGGFFQRLARNPEGLGRDAYTDMVQTVARLQPKARINGVTVQNMASAKRGR